MSSIAQLFSMTIPMPPVLRIISRKSVLRGIPRVLPLWWGQCIPRMSPRPRTLVYFHCHLRIIIFLNGWHNCWRGLATSPTRIGAKLRAVAEFKHRCNILLLQSWVPPEGEIICKTCESMNRRAFPAEMVSTIWVSGFILLSRLCVPRTSRVFRLRQHRTCAE
jgi:hypothetical protein